jgi:hypothetical protein
MIAAAVAILDQGVNLAGDEVDPGQQADRAITLVFMLACEGRMHAGHGRQIGGRRGNGLNTRLGGSMRRGHDALRQRDRLVERAFRAAVDVRKSASIRQPSAHVEDRARCPLAAAGSRNATLVEKLRGGVGALPVNSASTSRNCSARASASHCSLRE